MPTILLRGHQLSYPAADVLRLFFGPLQLNETERLQAGLPEPVIESCLDVVAGINGASHGDDHGNDSLGNDGHGNDRSHYHICTRLDGRLVVESVVSSAAVRREIKRQLYQTLAAWTGDEYPWGSLTGIRPTLVAAECLERLHSEDLARQELTDRWFVSPEKADLAMETAKAEQALLGRMPAGSILVYAGVPFCPSRCAYCSFITQDALHRAGLLEPYVEAMVREATQLFENLPEIGPAAAVYVGGGTPTSLPDPLFRRLLAGVLPQIPSLLAQQGFELTIEAGRPDTITAEKLAMIREAGTSRLCINPQTFSDETLARIGRRHSVGDTLEAFHLARQMGFTDINMDLIAGLPGEAPDDFTRSLEQALQLGPESITLHTLAMKRSSALQQAASTSHFGRPDPALAAMQVAGRQRLAQAGLYPYYLYRQKDVAGGLENTGFAKPGAGCLYNVGMMSDRCTVVGLGSGAMTKRVEGSRVERLANPRDIADYIRRIDEVIERKISFLKPVQK